MVYQLAPKILQLKLNNSIKSTPGTYTVDIIGRATGNSVTKTISFNLEIMDYCVVKAATSSLALDLTTVNAPLYEGYGGQAKIPFPTFDGVNKYTITNIWSSDVTPPAFEFSEFLYVDGVTDLTT